MNQLKRAQVVMLPTNNTINVLKGYTNKSLLFKYSPEYKSTPAEIKYMSYFHLYIISDDEIKKGDWKLDIFMDNPKPILADKNYSSVFTRKIIATTDTSLKTPLEYYGLNDVAQLPQPSQFITKYIEEYNKGNVITDVLVEYEQDYTNRNCSTCSLGTDGTCELNLEKKCCSSTNNVTKHGDYWISCLDGEEDSEIYKIIVTPKDSTITIKKLKDSWNREEIIEQMWLAYKAANTVFEDESALRIEFDNWIDQNL